MLFKHALSSVGFRFQPGAVKLTSLQVLTDLPTRQPDSTRPGMPKCLRLYSVSQRPVRMATATATRHTVRLVSELAVLAT